MKRFLDSLRLGMQRFMSDRYGYDELSYALSMITLIFIFLAYIPNLQFMSSLGLLLCIVLIYRTLSRNISKRQAERNAYLRWKTKWTGKFNLLRQAWCLRDTYRFYRCRQCKTCVRVPKGRGKIRITCPKCHNEFIKKT